MSKALVSAFFLVAACSASAQQVILKCNVTDLKDGKQSETWIVIDAASNSMRVDGVSRPLVMSNTHYASSERSGPFLRTTSVDRTTGEISMSSLYEGEVVLPRKGTCEKAALPATKF